MVMPGSVRESEEGTVFAMIEPGSTPVEFIGGHKHPL